MIKLTGKEKELIGIILDYEKEHLRRSYGVAEALGLPADASDMVPFKRLEKALEIDDIGDGSVEIIYGYTRGDYTLVEVYEVIEYVINKDVDKVRDWFERLG